MSIQPHSYLKWCLLCTQRRTDDVLCPSCTAELDMRVAAIVGEEPARFVDLLALVSDNEIDAWEQYLAERCACGARLVNEGDTACTQCSLLADAEDDR